VLVKGISRLHINTVLGPTQNPRSRSNVVLDEFFSKYRPDRVILISGLFISFIFIRSSRL
jgi:hypothetical protein